ncbi:hypothetical protein LPU83_pLPU83d_0536 (plasmid) [Rhizobium favelukesii]|uniref:Uncharacterized protein n=1 Tax=Rhizobium favelukesii TaxID=348824 RepID=W6RL95_9HYPH|nr:hypothetical protein LPU83_pLPU83d_0536 [Rhizobium favelukesii]
MVFWQPGASSPRILTAEKSVQTTDWKNPRRRDLRDHGPLGLGQRAAQSSLLAHFRIDAEGPPLRSQSTGRQSKTRPLRNRHLLSNRLVIEAELTAELRDVRELTCMAGESSRQLRHLFKLVDLDEVSNVSFDDRRYSLVLARPTPAVAAGKTSG